ncbi:hypothetical protein G6F35_012471 [Rhizopus arrhizus]|nr:hypothetical protein G6F35_012471 [Rhizopus arrhizus]
MPVVAELTALHRVLLGHQHRQLAAEGQVLRLIRLMVGKGMRHHADATRPQHVEEALRMGDAGHRVHTLALEIRQRARTATGQRLRTVDVQGHRPLAESTGLGCGILIGLAEVDHPEVALGSAADRLTQRSGRNHPAIAVAALGIDHFNFDVACQPVVLQAIVADDHIAAGLDQRLASGNAVTIHAHRHAGLPRDQHRLVAALGGRCVGLYPQRLVRILAAIATTGHTRLPAGGTQALDQGDGQRRLAGAACGDVADHDDRHRQRVVLAPAAPIGTPAQRGDTGVQRRQQAHRPGNRAAVIPMLVQATHAQQLLVGAAFNDATVVHHQHLVGMLDG